MDLKQITDPGVLSYLSGGKRVGIKYGEFTPSTDSEIIYLPSDLRYGREESDDRLYLRGLLDHETAHIKYTNFKATKDATPRLHGCVNALEDLRIDNIRAKQGAGFKLNQEARVQNAAAKYQKADKLSDDVMAILYMMQKVAGYSTAYMEPHMSSNARALSEQIMSLGEKALEAGSTDDIMPLARQMEEILYGDADAEPGSGSKSSSKSEEDTAESGDTEAPRSSEDASEDGPDSQPGTGAPSDGDDSEEMSEDTSAADTNPEEGDRSEEEPSDGSEDGERKEALDKPHRPVKRSESSSELLEVLHPKLDEVIKSTKEVYTADTSMDREIVAPPNTDDYIKSRQEVAHIISGSQQSFISSLFTETRSRFRRKCYHGSIDSRSLAFVASDVRIFKQRSSKIDLDTAITYLIDLSGSMSHHRRIVHARKSAILLSEITNRLAIPNEVLGFTSTGEKRYDLEYYRKEGIANIIFKTFDEPYNRVKYRLGNIKVGLGSEPKHSKVSGMPIGVENCDGESLLWAGRRMLNRRESRRIIVVLSDGAPAIPVRAGRYLLDQHLQESVHILRTLGIEVYAFGLGHDPSDYYGAKFTTVLRSEKDLTVPFMKGFSKILKKGKQ